jgi:hypothetical protein
MSSGETQLTSVRFLNALDRRDCIAKHIESSSDNSYLNEDLIKRGLARTETEVAELAAEPDVREYYEKLGDEVVKATGVIIELEPFLIQLGLEQEVAAKKAQIDDIVESPLWMGVRYFRDSQAKSLSAESDAGHMQQEQQKEAPFIEDTDGDKATAPEDAADAETTGYVARQNGRVGAKEARKASLVTRRKRTIHSTGAKALRGRIPSGEQDLPSPPPSSKKQEAENPHEAWARALQESVTEAMVNLRREGRLSGANHHADSLSGRKVTSLLINGVKVDILEICRELQEEGALLGRKSDLTIRDYIVMLQWDKFAEEFMNTDPKIRNAALGIVEMQIKRDLEETKRKERLANLVSRKP